MSSGQAIGIDVGGERKGFHLALLEVGANDVESVGHYSNIAEVLSFCRILSNVRVIAIDCPPRCQLDGPTTRLAERQLHAQGIRVQWTRRQTHEPAEWMKNGQNLWDSLREAFPYATTIETFPTVATPNLSGSAIRLPLKLLGQFSQQRDWKDFVDAAICVDVADRYLRGEAKYVGVDEKTGETDELGRIWY
jgi:predicted nuclease with RNAse H fold